MDIKSLKDKILQLAIQGKLVPQNENDEPASVLLEKIKVKKEQLIKDKVIKKERTLSDISEDEKSFDLPKGWEWCRLGKATICRDGDRVPVSSKEREDRAKIYDYYGASGVIDKIDDYLFDKPLLLIGEDGANLISRSTPIAFIAYGKYWVNNHAHVIDSLEFITLKYLEIYINAIDLKSFVTGTAQPKLNQANLNQIPIMLPPLEEQERIVAKVDELFELIDELDSNKQELLENIFNIKNKVLQLAIQGKLVEQCEDDEPASVLLERLKAEKEHLIKDKVIKKEKALPEITEEEKSFELPDTWKWCRLGNISAPENYSFVDGPFGSNLKREHYVDYGVRIIQLQNIGEGFWKDYNKIYTSIEKADELIRCNAFPGELVIAKMNPIARATIIPDNDKRYVLCSDCVKLKSYKDIDTGYLKYLMNSSYIKEKASEDGNGTTRQRTSLGKLKLMPIPLPPQEEQKRIVEKVDLIMNYLDTLQQEIESQEIILEDILK